jgi:hypothetical protein
LQLRIAAGLVCFFLFHALRTPGVRTASIRVTEWLMMPTSLLSLDEAILLQKQMAQVQEVLNWLYPICIFVLFGVSAASASLLTHSLCAFQNRRLVADLQSGKKTTKTGAGPTISSPPAAASALAPAAAAAVAAAAASSVGPARPSAGDAAVVMSSPSRPDPPVPAFVAAATAGSSPDLSSPSSLLTVTLLTGTALFGLMMCTCPWTPTPTDVLAAH